MDFLWLYMCCPLFQKMDQQLLLEASQCGWWQVRQQNSQQPLLQCGEPVRYIGVVLSGSVDIVFPDFWGNQTIVGRLGPGEEFAEAFFCAEVEKMPVNVVTADAGQVLLLDMNTLKNDTQPIGQKFYAGLMESMVHILARKNTVLAQRIQLLSRRRTREKLFAYLSEQALRCGATTFEIPFNRQQLADYLAVERSALSAQLSQMREEGILLFHRNRFTLLREQEK